MQVYSTEGRYQSGMKNYVQHGQFQHHSMTLLNPLTQFLNFFNTEPKTLVIDQSLTSTINYLIPFTKLQKTINISQVCWFADILEATQGEVVFVIDSKLANVEVLQRRIKEIGTTNVSVILTSTFFKTFKYELETNGTYLELYNWELFVKDDIIPSFYHLNSTIDLDQLYRFKAGDVSRLQCLLLKLLSENPRFVPNKIYHSHGEYSEALYKNFNKLYKQVDGLENSGLVTNLIIVERNFDLLRLVENNCDFINILQEYRSVQLNKIEAEEDIYFNDELWELLKFMNFDTVCKYLNKEAKDLQAQYQSLKSKKGDLNIVNDLNKLEAYKKLLIKYTNLCEKLISEIGVNSLDSNFNRFLDELNNHQDTYAEAIQSLINQVEYSELEVKYIIRLIFSVLIKFDIQEKDYNVLKAKLVERFGIQWFIVLDNIKTSYKPSTPLKSKLSMELILESILTNTAIENIKFTKRSNGRYVNVGKAKENFIIVFIGGVTYTELKVINQLQEKGIEIVTLSDGVVSFVDRCISI
ncbi:hypothetical protein WICPIJ_003841 [Wickerhamomyces pijperi]|uniref:Sec1-like protein n=1 Tax=Wickerhamomyces pijperi TaxID=599730 RepID=A0A9P8Q929_WICPI|nr:hypothetical protein WICPIJ_003841 [Wickerhamomyces pijperi]